MIYLCDAAVVFPFFMRHQLFCADKGPEKTTMYWNGGNILLYSSYGVS